MSGDRRGDHDGDRDDYRTARLEGGGSVYVCDKCGRRFGTGNALSVHEHTCRGQE